MANVFNSIAFVCDEENFPVILQQEVCRRWADYFVTIPQHFSKEILEDRLLASLKDIAIRCCENDDFNTLESGLDAACNWKKNAVASWFNTEFADEEKAPKFPKYVAQI